MQFSHTMTHPLALHLLTPWSLLLLLLVHTQSPTHSILIIGMDIAIALHCIGMDIGPCSVRSQSPTHCIFLHLDHHYYHSSLAGTQWEGDSSANIFSSHMIINIFSSHIIITRVPSFTHNNYPVTKFTHNKLQVVHVSVFLFPPPWILPKVLIPRAFPRCELVFLCQG